MKSRRTGWAGQVARMGDMRSVYKILLENLKRITRRRGDINVKINVKIGFIRLRI
jgi:hypothetical protein